MVGVDVVELVIFAHIKNRAQHESESVQCLHERKQLGLAEAGGVVRCLAETLIDQTKTCEA